MCPAGTTSINNGVVTGSSGAFSSHGIKLQAPAVSIPVPIAERPVSLRAATRTLRSRLGARAGTRLHITPIDSDLHGDIAFQDAGTLSGGEKTKLALAQLVAGRKNLLLLDEPTNNLDPPSRTAIAEALRGWPGTMIIVSHDPEFVEALAPERVLIMPEGQLDYFGDDHRDLVELA